MALPSPVIIGRTGVYSPGWRQMRVSVRTWTAWFSDPLMSAARSASASSLPSMTHHVDQLDGVPEAPSGALRAFLWHGPANHDEGLATQTNNNHSKHSRRCTASVQATIDKKRNLQVEGAQGLPLGTHEDIATRWQRALIKLIQPIQSNSWTSHLIPHWRIPFRPIKNHYNPIRGRLRPSSTRMWHPRRRSPARRGCRFANLPADKPLQSAIQPDSHLGGGGIQHANVHWFIWCHSIFSALA